MGTMGSWEANLRDLQDLWRGRVEMKERAYRAAAAHYGRLLNATLQEHSLESPGSGVADARVAADQAAQEYARVLDIFTQLTLHGRVPDESMAREAAGA